MAKHRRAWPRQRGLAIDRNTCIAIADNVLDRLFQADASNQKWVTDFTSIGTAEGWLDAVAMLNLYARRIVGGSMHGLHACLPGALQVRGGQLGDEAFLQFPLKTERTATKVYRPGPLARADVFDDIKRFYNPTRRRWTLGRLSAMLLQKAQKALGRCPRNPQQLPEGCSLANDAIAGWCSRNTLSFCKALRLF